jgi:ubiquinone/menaquinone biosynthesis C-methylase UbiE
MWVLDLGCGEGLTPGKLNLPSDWTVIGIDNKHQSLAKAHGNFPNRPFIRGAAENLPFRDRTFDRVIANVSLPYMNIPRALAEISRILVPGGLLLASLHPLGFATTSLRRALPNPKNTLYRCFVLANGAMFHVLGRNFSESFQTERGISIALRRANFTAISFHHDTMRWFVEATKPPTLATTA